MREKVTETQIGNTLFIVTSVCADDATETVEQILERLILQHASDAKWYQPGLDSSLDTCEIVREHGGDIK